MRTELLRLEDVCVSDGYSISPSRIRLHLFQGEILGLLGFSGSGKKAVLDLISGQTCAASGMVYVRDLLLPPGKCVSSSKLQMFYVRGRSSLVDTLTVAENVMVLRSAGQDPFQVVGRRKKEYFALQELFDRLKTGIRNEKKARDLTPSQRRVVELVKACFMGAHVVLYEDVWLHADRAEWEMVRRTILFLREEGMSVLFSANTPDRVMTVADRITVIHQRTYQRTVFPDEYEREYLVCLMAGRKLLHRNELPLRPHDRTVFSVRDLSAENVMILDELQLHAGELLGFLELCTGEESMLFKALRGIVRPDSCEIQIKERRLRGLGELTAFRHGIGFLCPDLEEVALFEQMNCYQSIVFNLHRFGERPRRIKKTSVLNVCANMGFPAEKLKFPVSRLNIRERMMIHYIRWILARPAVLLCAILGIPTDDIDWELRTNFLQTLSDYGTAILYYAQDINALPANCSRIQIVHYGHTIDSLNT